MAGCVKRRRDIVEAHQEGGGGGFNAGMNRQLRASDYKRVDKMTDSAGRISSPDNIPKLSRRRDVIHKVIPICAGDDEHLARSRHSRRIQLCDIFS